MIKQCFDKQVVYNYIGADYARCLYIYIDLRLYELTGDNFSVWVQLNDSGKICCVVSEYYKGIQIYSRNNDLSIDELTEFLREKDPPNIFGAFETIALIRGDFTDYEEEPGIVGHLKELVMPVDKSVRKAEAGELEEIVRLVAEDEDIGKPYGFESLYEQYKERFEKKHGRNYILREKTSGKIICHAGTYAETDDVAVIGGVITAPEFRGKGYSKQTLAALCYDLKNEGKDVFSFFYIPAAKRMHYGVGFEKAVDWLKIYRKG